MIEALTIAKEQSSDEPDDAPIETVYQECTGQRGRPRIVIDPDILRLTYQFRGPTALGKFFGISARTVRRQALAAGIVAPGQPVYVESVTADGTTSRTYTSSSGSVSDISDAQLDQLVGGIMTSFPAFGRQLIDGNLKAMGYHIPKRRLKASYLRVHGPTTAEFGARRIERRVYKVAGYNSLCHHDGQHGTQSLTI